MKKLVTLFALSFLMIACKDSGSSERLLPAATGKVNQLLVVMKIQQWEGKVGDEFRTVFGEHQVGLPQEETLFSATQLDPVGFKKFMRNNKSILVFQKGEDEGVKVVKDKYARPQTVVYITAKDEGSLIDILRKEGKSIMQIFKDSDIAKTQNYFAKNKLDIQKFKTIKELGIELTIPDSYRFVKDSIGFLWLRQHLKSGIARGDGSNNILVYSVPLEDETKVADNIAAVRDMMGEKHIPGGKEGMYMITEKAYTPHIFDAEIDGQKAYETRGKWEVQGDFMAGPFINYTVIDKKNNRLIIYEGFTYAPSVNKRDFIFELEAIGKSMKIK